MEISPDDDKPINLPYFTSPYSRQIMVDDFDDYFDDQEEEGQEGEEQQDINEEAVRDDRLVPVDDEETRLPFVGSKEMRSAFEYIINHYESEKLVFNYRSVIPVPDNMKKSPGSSGPTGVKTGVSMALRSGDEDGYLAVYSRERGKILYRIRIKFIYNISGYAYVLTLNNVSEPLTDWNKFTLYDYRCRSAGAVVDGKIVPKKNRKTGSDAHGEVDPKSQERIDSYIDMMSVGLGLNSQSPVVHSFPDQPILNKPREAWMKIEDLYYRCKSDQSYSKESFLQDFMNLSTEIALNSLNSHVERLRNMLPEEEN